MGEMELLRGWVAALVSGLHAEVDEETAARVMEHCGRACAAHFGSVAAVETLRRDLEGIDELLDGLNQQEDFWCGRWVRDGEVITSVCESCGCPLVQTGWVEVSPTLCQCSRGWVRAVFEAVLDRPVRVDLQQAIGRGDDVCRYVVVPKR